jgi:3-carboxy-cis,cis-muconate cycloisomerase
MTDPLPPSSLLTPLFSSAEMRAALDDRARLQRMLDFEAALARAEAAVGVILPSHAGAIAESCRSELYDLAALAQAAVPAGNLADPLVAALTAEVAKRNTKAAEHVHWGATGQDVIDTALALELRAAIDALLNDLDRATRGFTALAGRHRRNMTVARTLLQQALPMPFGLKLASYAAALARSRDRLRRLRKEALVLQFGGAAGTLASLGEKGLDVSERLAALLDLTVPDAPWHSQRDRLAEVAAAFAILAGTCGKIARDVALLMQGEIAEAFEPAAGDNPLALPRQRNPVGATAALSAAMIAPNLAATILNAQIQEHERSVGGWQTEWVTFPALALAVSGALHAVVAIAEGLTVDVDRMKANLEASGGLVLAEAVAVALVEKLGKTEAHELAAELTRQAAKEKRAFKDVVADNEQVRAHFNAVDLERLFMPNHYQGAAQTFIDRLVASSQGRTVRRSSSVSHLTDPKMPAARPDHLSAIKAATSAVKAALPADESHAAKPQPVAPAAAPTELGQAVAAASALIDQTISELAKPPMPPSNTAAEPVAAAPAPEPAPPVPEPAPAAPPEPVAAPEPAPAVVADAPSIDQPEEEEPGALLQVFARAAENENVEPGDDAEPKHKTA